MRRMRIIGANLAVSISQTGRIPGMSLRRCCSFGILAFLICVCPCGNPGRDPNIEKKRMALGRELFTREWLVGDPRSHAGDGLGPVFNARSCLACHHQGGEGGAGPKHSNATLVSVFVTSDAPIATVGLSINRKPDPAKPMKQPDRAKLAEIHPALRAEGSFPVHRFGTEREFTKWKAELFGEPLASGAVENEPTDLTAQIQSSFVTQSMGRQFNVAEGRRKVGDVNLALIPSQRNTPALFGVGLINDIPDGALEEVAAEQARSAEAGAKDKADSKAGLAEPGLFMEGQAALPLTGRVARLTDGRIG